MPWSSNREPGAGEQAGRVGDEDLPGPGLAHDPRRLVDGDAAHAAADELDLADVHACPDREPLGLGRAAGSPPRSAAPARARRTSRAARRRSCRPPGRGTARAGAAPTRSASRAGRASACRPSRAAMRGRVDEIGEEERDENAAVDPGREAGEGADPGPFDLYERLVADRPAVVSRRDVEDVLGAELELRAVLELDAEPSRQDHPEVPCLAPLAADRGAHAVVPAPARLMDEVADRDVSEVDHAHLDEGKLDDLVRPAEVLDVVLRHGAYTVSGRRRCRRRPRSRAAPARPRAAASRGRSTPSRRPG